MDELLTRLFFGGFVRLHVLYHALREPIFGVEMMEELGRHGYNVGAGTLYPLLHQLEKAGYLVSHTEVVSGKQRKYYRATPGGAAALEAAKVKLRELVSEVLHDRPPTPSTRSDGQSSSRRRSNR
jgi:PadR family transcriptional regulator, regulatory protein PadR